MDSRCQTFIKKLKALDPSALDVELSDELSDLAEPLERVKDVRPAVPAILAFFEKNPLEDHGAPGALVHVIERLPTEEYESALLESVNRRPTPHTLWMINRILNAEPPEKRRKVLVSALRAALKHPRAEEETRDAAREFLEE